MTNEPKKYTNEMMEVKTDEGFVNHLEKIDWKRKVKKKKEIEE
jgi:hypothetical protein